MLTTLSIKDYALIENVNIEFHSGLNIITGETGAGKSILLGALGLILGERANTDVIRRGSKKAVVEGIFDLGDNHKVNSILDEFEIETASELIVRREVSLKGSNRCFLNDTPVPLANVKRIGDLLVDLHGQHEHQSILNIDTHIELLDDAANISKEYNAFLEIYSVLQTKLKELKTLQQKEKSISEKRDLYEFQIKEIDAVNPVEGEDESLENELRILENSERLIQSSAEVYNLLYEDDSSIYDKINQVLTFLTELSDIDNSFREKAEECNSAIAIIDDIADFSRNYRDSIDIDPSRLSDIRERIAALNRLKKKYGKSLSEVIEHRQKIGEEFELADNFAEKIEELTNLLTEIRIKAGEKAKLLSKVRKDAADKLIPGIEEALKYLGISDSKFEVKCWYEEAGKNDDEFIIVDNTNYNFNKSGIDNIEFYISTNMGEETKPLVRVASGGEISRIMLALKTILAKNDKLPLLVFDEIDTGVSGRIAQKVGNTMKSLTEHHQIIAITHLPQIASLADHHYSVEKEVVEDRVVSSINELGFEERIDEVAKLLSGEALSEASRNSARELMGIS